MGTIKTILLLALVIGSMVTSHAADYLLMNNQFTKVYTNVLSFTATNGVTVTNSQVTAASVYHTFQFFYTASGTNTTTVVTDRTVDNSNWFPVATNTFTATASFETNYTGKWIGYRFRATFANSNAVASIPTLTIPYVAQ